MSGEVCPACGASLLRGFVIGSGGTMIPMAFDTDVVSFYVPNGPETPGIVTQRHGLRLHRETCEAGAREVGASELADEAAEQEPERSA